MSAGGIFFSATPHYQIWRTPIGAPPTLLPIRYSRSPAASPEVTSARPHTLLELHRPGRGWYGQATVAYALYAPSVGRRL